MITKKTKQYGREMRINCDEWRRKRGDGEAATGRACVLQKSYDDTCLTMTKEEIWKPNKRVSSEKFALFSDES